MTFKTHLNHILTLLSLLFVLNSSESKGQTMLSSISPNPNEVVFSTELVLNWNESILESSTSSFSYIIATDSNLSNIVSQIGGLNQYSDTLTSLTNGKYYWRLAIVDSAITVAFSKVQSFFIYDISSFMNLSHFYSADTGLVLDANGKVFKWLNLADTSRSLIQSDSSFRPIPFIDSSFFNSTAVSFDGGNDFLVNSSSFGFGDLFMIANWGGGSTFAGFRGLLTGTSSYIILVGNGINGNQRSFFNISPLPLINSISTLDFSPLEEHKLINQFRTTTLNAPDIQMGKDRGFAGRFWDGNVTDLIVSSTILNSDERRAINHYLCNKYFSELELGEDLISQYSLCDSSFTVDTSFTTYLWSNADTTPNISLEMGKEYRLTVTTPFGCEYVDNISLQSLVYSPMDLILCPGDSFLWELELSHDGYDFLWSDLSTDSLLRISNEGNYSVVVTDTNGCSISSDTISVQFDSSLYNYTLGPDTAVCRGNPIALINYDNSITSILWSTGNTSEIQYIDTAGTYTIEYSDGSCTLRDTIIVSLKGLAPNANFSTSDFCFRDTVSFRNTSTAVSGDTLIEYYWNFTATDSSIQKDPRFSFPDTGQFRVLLTVVTDKGCQDSVSQVVEIDPLPIPFFSVNGNCSKRPIQMTSTSTIDKGSIQAFYWEFDNGLSTSIENPLVFFDTLGTYNVLLRTTSDKACVDSIRTPVTIDPTATPSFIFENQCLGDSTFLTSTSQIPSGGIVEYDWFTNGQQIEDSLAKVLYLSDGGQEVILRLRSDKNCLSTIRDTIEIYEKPTADFVVSNICLGDTLKVQNSSIAVSDSIISYFYRVIKDSLIDTSSLNNPTFIPSNSGLYQLKLTIETENSCSDSITKSFVVNDNPEANFRIINNGSGAPYTLEVDDQSKDASSYLWISGDGQTSCSQEAVFIYRDSGTYSLQQIVFTAENCSDTIARELNVSSYFLDASILDAQLIEDGNDNYRIRLELANEGNNKINAMEVYLQAENQLNIAEQINSELYKGKSLIYTLNTILPRSTNDLAFICFTINSVNNTRDDISENNRLCISAIPNSLYLTAYPNPVVDWMNLEFVLLESGRLSVRLFDSEGKEILNPIDDQFYEEGYQLERINLSTFKSGIYFLRFSFEGFEEEMKIVKH